MSKWILSPVFSRLDTLWICIAALAFSDRHLAGGVIVVVVGVAISTALCSVFLEKSAAPAVSKANRTADWNPIPVPLAPLAATQMLVAPHWGLMRHHGSEFELEQCWHYLSAANVQGGA